MNKEIDLIFQGVPYHGQKILKNGIRPAFAASGMTLKTLRNFISEMGIGRVDELQKNLQNLIVLINTINQQHRDCVVMSKTRHSGRATRSIARSGIQGNGNISRTSGSRLAPRSTGLGRDDEL